MNNTTVQSLSASQVRIPTKKDPQTDATPTVLETPQQKEASGLVNLLFSGAKARFYQASGFLSGLAPEQIQFVTAALLQKF